MYKLTLQKSIYQFFFFLHTLSIDIAFGACALLYAIHQLLFDNLAPVLTYQYILLFLSTLCVYYIDHIQDSKIALLVQPGKRHNIFKQYKTFFVFLVGLMVLICVFISLKYLPILQIIGGLILCSGIFIYLLFHRKFKRKIILEKEILIAMLYTLSVFYFPFSTAIMKVSSLSLLFRPDQVMFFLLVILIVFLTALQNLLSFAVIEKDHDEEGNIRSIATLFGSDRLRHLQLLLLLLQGVSSLMFLLLTHAAHLTSFLFVIALIASINYLLPFIFAKPKNSYYRILGDGCFILAFLV